MDTDIATFQCGENRARVRWTIDEGEGRYEVIEGGYIRVATPNLGRALACFYGYLKQWYPEYRTGREGSYTSMGTMTGD